MPRILITNDDGIHSEGIGALEKQLCQVGEVIVVAPSHEMSAASRALTLTRPLRIDKIDESHYAVDGTPADCVTIAMNKILTGRLPDIVVSGINRGGNLGDDVFYSGTVAGAMEAVVYGLPGIAISLLGRGEFDFGPAADFAVFAISKILREGLPERTVLNVNVPQGPIRGVRLTHQGVKIVHTRIIEGTDPRGRKYYWIGEELSTWDAIDGTDYQAIRDGCISVTPLQSNLTNHDAFSELESWNTSVCEPQRR
jgi:5'-nucleotidase